jgi:GxxExxY protein
VELKAITEAVIGSAIEVHRELGPGLLESTYEACLAYELTQRGLDVLRQLHLPLRYKEIQLDAGYKVDLLVERSVIVELKAVDKLDSIHEAQLLSYLRLSGCHVGLLINFNVRVLKDGIKRMVHRLPEG